MKLIKDIIHPSSTVKLWFQGILMKIKNFRKISKYVELPLSKIKKIELILKSHDGNLFLIGGVVRCLVL